MLPHGYRLAPPFHDVHLQASDKFDVCDIYYRLHRWGIVDPSAAQFSIALLQAEWADDAAYARFSRDQLFVLHALYVKDVLSRASSEARKANFRAALGIVDADEPVAVREAADAQCRRLQQLFCVDCDKKLGYTDDDAIGCQTFDTFAEGTAWTSNIDSWVFFRDFLPGSSCLVLRWGTLPGSSCSLHAADLVLHYAVCRHAHVNDTVTIDLTAFLQRSLSGAELWQYSEAGTGHFSLSCLQELSGVGAHDLLTLYPDRLCQPDEEQHIIDNLVAWGPALISCFEVHDDLLGDSEGVTFCGRRESTRPKRRFLHAAVLVGWRREVDPHGVVAARFLVQLSWKHKQFVECDAAYLAVCGACVSWISVPVARLSGLLTQSALIAVSDGGAEANGVAELCKTPSRQHS